MRKIIQYYPETKYERTIALCDDGTLWWLNSIYEWEQFPEIPQDVPTERSKEEERRSDDGKPVLLYQGKRYRLCGMALVHTGNEFITEAGEDVMLATMDMGERRMIVKEIM